MYSLRLALVALLFLPHLALGASFAKQSLFLSKSPVIEGESVLIHTVVQNDAATTFDGSLVVFAQKSGGEKEKIGSVAVSMPPQGANTVSVSWKPASGEYAVTAELTGGNGAVVESQSARFTINEKPKPAATDSSFNQVGSEVQSSADVQAMIAKFSPPAADISKPVFDTIDSLRVKAGAWLDQGINWSKSSIGSKSPSEVLGASTQQATPQGILGTLSYLAAMFALYFFSVLKWLVANTGVFYPVLAIAFLFLLWKLLSRFRRPSY